MSEVFLFPLNVVVALPTSLEGGAGSVADELRAYLGAHGKRIASMPLREAQNEWLESAMALKLTMAESQMSFEGAAAVLARRLHRQRSFDVLVIPWIVLRPAKVRGRSVSWDGVVRTFALSDASDRYTGFFYHFGARTVAPSLQVTVFSPTGEKIFEGTGGLDLADEVTIDAKQAHVDFHPRKQLFTDRTLLREGIAIALTPFLPELAEQHR